VHEVSWDTALERHGAIGRQRGAARAAGRGDGDGSAARSHHGWPQGAQGCADGGHGIVGCGIALPRRVQQQGGAVHTVCFQHLGGDEIGDRLRHAELDGGEDGARAAAVFERQRLHLPCGGGAGLVIGIGRQQAGRESNSIAKQPASFLDNFFGIGQERILQRRAIRDRVSGAVTRTMARPGIRTHSR